MFQQIGPLIREPLTVSIAIVQEKGLRRVTSRKEWPQDVKRKALIELMKDTPRQLLAKELWLASSGAASAFERQQK